jgi:indolepyruvate ferredoxin oxidoreductase alpha subunit
MGSPAEKISIEKVAESCGVKYVKVVSPFRVKEAADALKGAVTHDGPSVVVFRAPCALLETRQKRRKRIETVPAKITEKCTHCQACVKLLGCPALIVEEGKVRINVGLCVGCGLCASICPYDAIECRICEE